MAHVNEDDPLARDELAGSAEALVTPAAPRGDSNSRAFKIAGLTTLACLLLCGQVFTAYLVFDQKHDIQMLKVTSDKMARLLSRPAPAMSPVKMAIPMNTQPLTMEWNADPKAQKSKFTSQPAPEIKTKCQLEAEPGAGKLGSFRPQCDEQGRYATVQCWHATGYCWCVDETGTARKDTATTGKPDCDKAPAPTPTPELIID